MSELEQQIRNILMRNFGYEGDEIIKDVMDVVDAQNKVMKEALSKYALFDSFDFVDHANYPDGLAQKTLNEIEK